MEKPAVGFLHITRDLGPIDPVDARIPDRLRTTGRPLRNRHARAKALTRSPISFGKPAYPFPRSNAPGRIWRSLGSTRSRGSADASTDRRAWYLATSAFPSLPASNRTNRPPTSWAERSFDHLIRREHSRPRGLCLTSALKIFE